MQGLVAGSRTRCWFILASALVMALAAGCASKGYLKPREPVTPTPLKVAAGPGAEDAAGKVLGPPPFAPFADSLIGFAFDSADSTRRYLGRLSDGYVADTLNVIIFGDNRPGWKSSYLRPQGQAILDICVPQSVELAEGPGGGAGAPREGHDSELHHVAGDPRLHRQHAGVRPGRAGARGGGVDDRFPRGEESARGRGDQRRRPGGGRALCRAMGAVPRRSPGRSTRGFPTCRSPATTSAPSLRKASRTGTWPPASRSATIASTTASTPPTAGCASSPSTPIRSPIPMGTGPVRWKSRTPRSRSTG